MDIKILDSWLRDYLDTKAKPQDLAKYLSLCGPSIERVKPFGKDFVYEIEVTTNRIDSASVYGIAREAAAILPRFKIAAKLKDIPTVSKKFKFVKKVKYLEAKADSKLCPRFTAVLIRDVQKAESPDYIKKRLESAGIRPINNIVDVSNYIMLELGQPVHTFDYDKISGSIMTLRESKKGEKITTLDGKTFTLHGGDIVIEDGDGRLIDLAGVMGGKLSAISDTTKNVLLFVQTYDPISIRKTSMSLAQRTMAATIFEKGTDTETVAPAIIKGISLFETLTKGKAETQILDIYPNPYKTKEIEVDYGFIKQRIGIDISKNDISNYLDSLNFKTKWNNQKITVSIPSFRSKDVTIAEDVVEEIARIYGYHNLPSIVMDGNLPSPTPAKGFVFEKHIKDILSGWGGVEVYTLALVPKEYTKGPALELKNPLGIDTAFLRTSLMPSLVYAAKENLGTFDKFHMFEMANVYIPRKMDLPNEKLTLAGILNGYDFREAKGIVEALFEKINIKINFVVEEADGFIAGKCTSVKTNGKEIGKFGYVENSELLYYQFEIENLRNYSQNPEYIDIPKYPAHIEDVTLVFPAKTRIGEVLNLISATESVSNAELKDVYKDAYTFRIWYLDKNKTLTDSEVEKQRNKIINEVKTKFGGNLKD